MSSLYNHLFDAIPPKTLTGFARTAFETVEREDGFWSKWLPTVTGQDNIIAYSTEEEKHFDRALWRAWDTEVATGKEYGGTRHTMELMPLGEKRILSEQEESRLRNQGAGAVVQEVLKKTRANVNAIFNALEYSRMSVFMQGGAAYSAKGAEVAAADMFGRDSEASQTAANKWNTSGGKPFDDIRTWVDKYVELNKVEPGALVLSRAQFAALAMSPAFKTVLPGGGERPGTFEDVSSTLLSYGLPQIYLIPSGNIAARIGVSNGFLLPDPSNLDAAVGRMAMGVPVQASREGWEESELPGVYASVLLPRKEGGSIEVVASAVAAPVLVKPNSVFALDGLI